MLFKELGRRKSAAMDELRNLVEDLNRGLLNYNHYYTDNIQKKRQERLVAQLRRHAPSDISALESKLITKKLIDQAMGTWSEAPEADMEDFACEEALDCMLAIYKVSSSIFPAVDQHCLLVLPRRNLTSPQKQVQQKVFVANVTTQVIERRLIHGLRTSSLRWFHTRWTMARSRLSCRSPQPPRESESSVLTV